MLTSHHHMFFFDYTYNYILASSIKLRQTVMVEPR